MPLFSIIIPTCNRPRELSECVQSLFAQKNLLMYGEIIIVDDGSNPVCKQALLALQKTFTLTIIFHEKNRGVAVARNTGAEKAHGSWLVFLDDDVIVSLMWQTVLLKQLSDAENRGCVGIEGAVAAMGKSVWDREVENSNGKSFITCHMIYKKDAFLKSGGFDDAFENMGPFCEDHELASRMLMRGEIPFCKELLVFHQARKFNFFGKIATASKRMKQLLFCDSWFYERAPLQYWRFRHRNHYLKSLVDVLFKHVIICFRRRFLRQIISHPLEALCLLCVSCIEQATAWFCLPQLISAKKPYKPTALLRHADMAATRILYNSSLVNVSDVVCRPNRLLSILFPVIHAPVYNCLKHIQSHSTLCNLQKPRILIRIDDFFPDVPELSDGLIELLISMHLPVLGAIPGKYLADKSGIVLLEAIALCGGTSGLHGFTHCGTYGPYNNEISNLTFPQLKKAIDTCLQYVPQELKPKAFVPPFNGIDAEHIVYLSSLFPIVCGGPETMRATDRVCMPLVLDTKGVYVPSIQPWYSTSYTILKNGLAHKALTIPSIHCFTFHAPYEWEYDRFTSLKKVLTVLSQSVCSWETVL